MIFPGTKSLAQKRAALRRIKWSLSAYFSLGQQENFSLYINMLGSLRQRRKIIFGPEPVPCIFRKKTGRRPSRMELYIVSFSPWTLKIWLVILFCGCYIWHIYGSIWPINLPILITSLLDNVLHILRRIYTSIISVSLRFN